MTTTQNENGLAVTESSGNVFADLNIDKADEYLLKAELAFKISTIIKDAKLTQKTAANILEIDQPKVSALACGRLSGFSVERLLKFLTKLNQDIDIIIRPHDPARCQHRKISHMEVIYIPA